MNFQKLNIRIVIEVRSKVPLEQCPSFLALRERAQEEKKSFSKITSQFPKDLWFFVSVHAEVN